MLSLSHSKTGQGVQVTPSKAPGSDAKAVLPPQLWESIATIQFGGTSRPHTVQKARRQWLKQWSAEGSGGKPLTQPSSAGSALALLPPTWSRGRDRSPRERARARACDGRLTAWVSSCASLSFQSPRVTCLP